MNRRRVAGIVSAAAASLSLAAVPAATQAAGAGKPSSSAVRLTLEGAAQTPPIHTGFLGFSFEYNAVAPMAGSSPRAMDPVLLQLIRNLDPRQRPVIRIGGDSGDHTWWPARGIRRSPGLKYELTKSWIATLAHLSRALDARLMLGIDLEADQPALAGAEARALVNGVGKSYVASLQLGNEPSLYHAFPWYEMKGNGVRGRGSDWSVSAYIRDYSRISRSLPQMALSGPDLGDPGWMKSLGTILHDEPRIRQATYHRYAGSCYGARGTPQFPSIDNLLSAKDSRGLGASIVPFVRVARGHGEQLRVDEMNSEACGGRAGVSNTFASALWVLDTLFAMASHGAAGVNIQTFPSARYRLFAFSRRSDRWSGTVAPEYYGLLLFADAAPPSSELLKVSGGGGDPWLRAWATKLGAVRRVLLINDSRSSAHSVSLQVNGSSARAQLVRLTAAGASATRGVRIGGQSFGASTRTGKLPGSERTQSVTAVSGRYQVRLPAASAALLELPGR